MADLPDGYKDIPDDVSRKAKVFFDRAKTVAGTGNYEYAIEMYLQGLALDPESIEAHQAMREISMVRKANGGKPMGMKDKWSLPKVSKEDYKQAMLNAEKMLAYDPGSMDNMVQVLVNAQKAGCYDTVMWLGPILFRANSDQPEKKQDYGKYITLKETYIAIQNFQGAIEALAAAHRAKPDDMGINQELKDLSARNTIKGGNYEMGDFRKSMRDVEGQRKRLMDDMDVRTTDILGPLIADAEKAYAAEPNEPQKLVKLLDLLKKTEQLEYENRAIEILDQKYKDTRQYKYKHQIGQIQIAQMARSERSLREALAAKPTDAELIKEHKSFLRYRAEEELRFYTETAEAYPTESGAKFEMGKRLFMLGRFGEAIPTFQQSRQDPKFRAQAGVFLGRCFLEAQFPDEAVDTLQQAIADYPLKGDDRSIDMHYWYARALEDKQDFPVALKMYSQVAQWNFNYRDVQQRIKRLRTPPPSAQSA